MRAVVFIAAAAGVARAATTHKPEPNPALNPVPTDTSNPRLVGKAFPYDQLPEHVDTSGPQAGVNYRGPQSGYNICNATTEGQSSECQTILVNSINDFCMWGPPKPDSIGDSEGEEVAWCTLPGHGARVIPAGTFTGLQWITAPSYVALTGHLNQKMINVVDNEGGGELDSGGQDNRGNPIGGAAYSISLPGTNGTITQSRTWHMFIGNGVFCMKLCTPTAPDALGICQHVYDTIGCNYNVPAAYQDGVFLSCEGEDQDPVGIYTGADGQVSTFQNPGEDAIPMPPFQPRIPATSNCVTFASSELFTVSTTSTSTSSSATSTGAGGSGTSSSATATGTAGKGGAVRGVGTAGAALGVALASVLVGAALVW